MTLIISAKIGRAFDVKTDNYILANGEPSDESPVLVK